MFNRLAGKPRDFARLILVLIAIPGVLIFGSFVGSPSEVGNQFLLGLSRTRFVIALFFAFLLMLNIGAILLLGIGSARHRPAIVHTALKWMDNHASWAAVILSLLSLVLGTIWLCTLPPVIRSIGFFEPIGARFGPLLFWLFLAASLLTWLVRVIYRDTLRENRLVLAVDHFLLVAGIFLVTFFSYEHLLIWMKGANQSRYAYWNLLAEEFLRGNLYLSNPTLTHDLTFYKGHWYFPNPPMPAILMMPLAYWIGGKNINTSDFSIVLSALSVVLMFLILENLSRRKWITLSRTGMLILVLLFAFGTPQLWVGIRGRAWFVSQVVTVLFLALAVWVTLKSWSPWLVGACIGCAVLSRPNGLMTWPFVFAIAMQMLQESRGTVTYRQALAWSIKSVIPIGLAVGGQLLYNYVRFGSFSDFGYVTISGDPTIVANAQTYGMFSLHYVLGNLKVMFLAIPAIQPGEQWPILPSSVGMSIFLTTPAFFYLFNRYERRWWIWGAWLAVLFNFLLLVLYHNTGAHQFGYRYILDAIVPVMCMLAVALHGKIRWHFVLLVVISILFNIYGAYWFING